MVSIYGDSYGTYFAQAFAVRHPDRVNAVVLDAAFALDGFDPWGRTATDAIRAAWTAVCDRSPTCPSADPVAELGALAERFRRTPLIGRSRDADGASTRSAWTAPRSPSSSTTPATPTRSTATCSPPPARWTPATRADAAARRRGPHVRRGRPGRVVLGGRLRGRHCHDYPTIWNVGSGFAARRAELATFPGAAARRRVRAVLAGPVAELALRAPDRLRLPRWPAPAVADPLRAARRRVPDGAGARPQRRSRRGHADVGRRPRRRAVPERDAGAGRQRRPRHRARRLRRLRRTDRARLPALARRRRHELRVRARGAARRPGVPADDGGGPRRDTRGRRRVERGRPLAAPAGPPRTPSPTRSRAGG